MILSARLPTFQTLASNGVYRFIDKSISYPKKCNKIRFACKQLAIAKHLIYSLKCPYCLFFPSRLNENHAIFFIVIEITKMMGKKN